jgi:hypothetical protein
MPSVVCGSAVSLVLREACTSVLARHSCKAVRKAAKFTLLDRSAYSYNTLQQCLQ